MSVTLRDKDLTAVTMSSKSDNESLENIYYSQDDDKKVIMIDTYAMELEAKHKLIRQFPEYKVEVIYCT